MKNMTTAQKLKDENYQKAYNYYCNCCKSSKEEPICFLTYCGIVEPILVNEMIKLYNL